MEILFLFLVFVIGAIVFQLIRPKNFDQPVSSWSNEELARRLVNYERIWSIAVKQALSGNIESINEHSHAGHKAKEIREEIERRRSPQVATESQRSPVTENGDNIEAEPTSKPDVADTNSKPPQYV